MIGRTNAVVKIGGGIVEDAGTGEFEARYCFFDKYGKYQIINKYADIMGTFEKPSTVGDVPENVGYNPALIFQGWNFDDIELTNVTGDLDIGAIYIPADGKTHIYIDIENDTLLNYTFYVQVINTGGGTFYFDFGDGTTPYSVATTGIKTIPHTYSTKGSYHLVLWLDGADENGEIVLGNNSSNYNQTFVGVDYTSPHINTVKRIYFGSNSRRIPVASIAQLRACEAISFHNSFLEIQMYNYYSLNYLSLPKSITTGSFGGGTGSFRFMSIPINISTTLFQSDSFGNRQFDKIISAQATISIASSIRQTQHFIKSINILGASTFNLYNTYANVVSLSANLTSLSSTNATNNYNPPIKILVMRATTPPTLSNSLGYYCKIYVPQASLSAYQSATNWSNYASQMVGY